MYLILKKILSADALKMHIVVTGKLCKILQDEFVCFLIYIHIVYIIFKY